MTQFRKAREEELSGVMQFYYDLIDAFPSMESRPGWKKGIYPTEAMIQAAIENRELLIGISEQRITAAMILNHSCADNYENAPWGMEAARQETGIIHALGVSADCQGKGLAKQMLSYAAEICWEQGIKTLRLDVLTDNVSARKLYAAAGFTYVDTVQIYYADTGLTDFELYELIL